MALGCFSWHLADMFKSKTGKAHWGHLQELVEAFGGERRRPLKQDFSDYKKSHPDLVELAEFMLPYLTAPKKSH